MANRSASGLFDLRAVPVFQAICLSLNTVAIIGNSLACTVFITRRKFYTRSIPLFQLNQCVVDLCTPLLVILKIVIPRTRYSDHSLVLHYIGCLWMTNVTLAYLHSVSVVNFGLMSAERYCAFYHPVKHRLWFTCGIKARRLILLNWLCNLVMWLSAVIPSKHIDEQSEKCIENSVTVFLNLFVYVIFFPTATIICFVRIFIRFNHLAKKRGVDRGAAIQHAKYSMLLTILSLFVLTMVVQLPLNAVVFVDKFSSVDWGSEFMRSLFYFTIFFLSLKCLGTSLIYTVASKRFRDKLAGWLWKVKRKVVRNKVQVLPLDAM